MKEGLNLGATCSALTGKGKSLEIGTRKVYILHNGFLFVRKKKLVEAILVKKRERVPGGMR